MNNMDDDILSLKKRLLDKDAEIAALKSKLEKIQKVCIHIHMSNTAPSILLLDAKCISQNTVI